jgi:hypothetical protein
MRCVYLSAKAILPLQNPDSAKGYKFMVCMNEALLGHSGTDRRCLFITTLDLFYEACNKQWNSSRG